MAVRDLAATNSSSRATSPAAGSASATPSSAISPTTSSWADECPPPRLGRRRARGSGSTDTRWSASTTIEPVAPRAARSGEVPRRRCRTTGAYREGRGARLPGARAHRQRGRGGRRRSAAFEANELNHLFATVAKPGLRYRQASGAGRVARRAGGRSIATVAPCMDKTSQWAAACMIGDLRRSAGLLYDVYRIGTAPASGDRPVQPLRRVVTTQRSADGSPTPSACLRRRPTQMLDVGARSVDGRALAGPRRPDRARARLRPDACSYQRGRRRPADDWLRRAWQRAETLENGAYSMAHVSAELGAVLGRAGRR